MDIKAGFHNVPAWEPLQKFSGRTTQDGLYVAQRMQFGYTAAPAHFQHVMATALDSNLVEWVEDDATGGSQVLAHGQIGRSAGGDGCRGCAHCIPWSSVS